MFEKYIIAYDVGTNGTKAILTDLKNIIGSAFEGYGVDYPKPAWAEQHPCTWWNALVRTTREILKKTKTSPNDIVGVSISAQMINTLPVDKDGNPLRPCMSWLDIRSVREAEWIKKNIRADQVCKITGFSPQPISCMAKILWLKRNEPEVFDKAYKIIDCKDYIDYKLTGKFVTDFSCASQVSLFDITKKEWSQNLCEQIGLPLDKLPEPYPSTHIIGEMTNEAAKETGLKKGTPVVAGGGDVTCAAVGAGAVRDGDSHLCLGTSAWVGVTTETPIIDAKNRALCMCSNVPNKWLVMTSLHTAGECLRWFKDELGKSETDEAKKSGISPYTILDCKAEEAEPGSMNLIFLPYMYGVNSPIQDPYARGGFVGLTTRHKKAHLIRSILEGVAYHIRWIIDTAEDVTGSEIKTLNILGGGTLSKTWVQILSDISDRYMLPIEWSIDAGAMGAAYTGAVGLKVCDFEDIGKLVPKKDEVMPRKENTQKYNRLYEIFRRIYSSLKDIYPDLSTS